MVGIPFNQWLIKTTWKIIVLLIVIYVLGLIGIAKVASQESTPIVPKTVVIAPLETKQLEVAIKELPKNSRTTPETLAQAVHRMALKYNRDEVVAKRILKCEAEKYTQEKKGTAPLEVDGRLYYLVLDSYNANKNGTVDRTVAQINSIHYPTMHKLGLSEYRWVDGLTFMFILLKRNGYSDYSASKACWSK